MQDIKGRMSRGGPGLFRTVQAPGPSSGSACIPARLQVWTFILSDATFRLAPNQVRRGLNPARLHPSADISRAGCHELDCA